WGATKKKNTLPAKISPLAPPQITHNHKQGIIGPISRSSKNSTRKEFDRKDRQERSAGKIA
ncbi:hypothetical protein ACFW9D_15140, partial [Streptomyces sp. NPDC059524]|uniref:hypothetical protein n=1 Tax=Streptomyces sp. NPDC059524 TaxID=3346856 RepID=UPI0036819FAE